MLQSNCQTTLMLTCWYETQVFYLLLYQLSYPQRFWGHGVPSLHRFAGCWRNLRLLEGNQEGFLASPAATLKQRLALTSDQWPAKVQRTAALGMAMFDLNCLKSLEDWRWCTDTWWGLPRKIKNRYIDFRWRWSMYINASYSVSLGRAKVFPPESLRCDDSPIAFVSSICFYGWAIVVSLFLCYGNPLQKVGFATANWNFWNPLRIGALVLL